MMIFMLAILMLSMMSVLVVLLMTMFNRVINQFCADINRRMCISVRGSVDTGNSPHLT